LLLRAKEGRGSSDVLLMPLNEKAEGEDPSQSAAKRENAVVTKCSRSLPTSGWSAVFS
jgi:hypothetical protein